jgi:hypothetical protein
MTDKLQQAITAIKWSKNAMIHNPHLEGDPFFWKAGPVGVLLSQLTQRFMTRVFE